MASLAAPQSWKVKASIVPDAAVTELEAFTVVLNKHTTLESFCNTVTGRLNMPTATELALSDEDAGTALSIEEFVTSAKDYCFTGCRDLTPDSVDYFDSEKWASVRLGVTVLARDAGATLVPCHR